MNLRREQLLGYLLGALDDAERQQVEDELGKNPTLRVEMARFQELLSRLGMDEEPTEHQPPDGLAARTCDFVAAHAGEAVIAQAVVSPVQLSPAPVTAGDISRGYTLTDILVACSVLLTLGALLFPSLNNMRFQAQRAMCQYRLVQTGGAFWDFAQFNPDGSYPGIPEKGNRAVAGFIPVLLRDAGFLEPQNEICPSSGLGQETRGWRPPTCRELDEAVGPTLRFYQKTMGGSYAYNMGYTTGGRLVPACWQGREGYALVADVPTAAGDPAPAPHDGLGCNVLYEDGHVRFLPTARKLDLPDDPYRNRIGFKAAGLDANDSSLGPSDARPVPYDDWSPLPLINR